MLNLHTPSALHKSLSASQFLLTCNCYIVHFVHNNFVIHSGFSVLIDYFCCLMSRGFFNEKFTKLGYRLLSKETYQPLVVKLLPSVFWNNANISQSFFENVKSYFLTFVPYKRLFAVIK